jgi:hypothetical protein
MFVANGLELRAMLGSTQDQSNSQSLTVHTQVTGSPPAPITDIPYNSNLIARSQLSALIKTIPDSQGWLYPSAYRRFATLYKGESFDMIVPTTNPRVFNPLHAWGAVTPTNGTYGPGATFPYWGTILSGGVYIPDVSANTIAQAETECLNKLSEGTIALGASIGEGKQTIEQIVTGTTSLIKAFAAIKRGNFKKAAKELGTAWTGGKNFSFRSAWLALQYAWLPLMSDIYSGFDAFIAGMRSKNAYIHAQRSVTKGYPDFPRPAALTTWKYSGRTQTGCSVSLWATVEDEWLHLLESIGLTNPLAIAWELMPFSFVVDWLLPIGNFLQAITATLGLKFKAGSRTIKSWSDVRIEMSIYPSGIYLTPGGQMPKCRMQNLCMVRTNYGGFPIPKLYIKSPFSSTHVASAIALLGQLR